MIDPLRRPREGDAALGEFAGYLEGLVTSVREERWIFAPEKQQPLGQEQLDPPIAPVA